VSGDGENPIKPWENVLWTVEPIFAGETVFCFASGPSMTQAIADKVKGRKAIVVNSTCPLVPWADVLFFTDNGWYETHREIVKNWPGIVVCLSRLAKREMPERVHRIKCEGAPPYPPRRGGKYYCFPDLPAVQQGRTSGHTAVGLAIGMGAKRVVLCGYDMQLVNGREHHHTNEPGYTGPRDLAIYAHFATGFDGWQAAAVASGVEILNATTDSACKEFPFVRLEDVL
jgi:hypothetical protein